MTSAITKLRETIYNPRTGQRTHFVRTAAETDGEVLEIESVHPPGQPPEPEHTHPLQTSRIEVLSGTMWFRIDGVDRAVGPGEVVEIPPGIAHYFWNDSQAEARMRQEFRPALGIEDFFRTYFALAQDNKLGASGLPSLLRLAVMMKAYDREIRATTPPRAVQLVLMWALAPIGRVLGYRATYP